jgi:hypothetical protein
MPAPVTSQLCENGDSGPENFAETANGGYSRVNAAAFASMRSIPGSFLV